MDIQVNLDAEAIQKQLVQAIMDGSIGAALKKGIEAALAETKGYGSRSFVEDAVRSAIYEETRNAAVKLVAEKRDWIREQMAAKLTEEFLALLTARAWDGIEMKLRER